tara:strand:- start:70552 stop:70812 length:261 start_codon:yes stop_codon:yes gene_type:complete
MNKEQFEKKAEELFKKYSYQGVHGGDLVIGENGFDYLIEQLHEALTIPVVVVVVVVPKDTLKTNKFKCPCKMPFSQTWCEEHERWT